VHADSALELSVPGPDADKRCTAFMAALSSRGVAASRLKLASPAVPTSPAVPEATVAAKPIELAKPAAVELSFSVG
jgi:hypothetical protein